MVLWLDLFDGEYRVSVWVVMENTFVVEARRMKSGFWGTLSRSTSKKPVSPFVSEMTCRIIKKRESGSSKRSLITKYHKSKNGQISFTIHPGSCIRTLYHNRLSSLWIHSKLANTSAENLRHAQQLHQSIRRNLKSLYWTGYPDKSADQCVAQKVEWEMKRKVYTMSDRNKYTGWTKLKFEATGFFRL